MKRLSVIVPIFGVEKYISRCLDSIYALGLHEDEFEVICVDDCSMDASVSIIQEYCKRYANLILLHHNENKKQGGARNTAISFASGQYVIFVDADDCLPHYDLSHLLDYMRDNDLDLLLGMADCYKKEGRVVTRWGNAPEEASSIMAGPQIFEGEYIHKIAFGVVWMGIYRMDLIKRVGPFVEKVFYEDADWTMRCAYEAHRLQYTPMVIYHYMENVTSTTKAGSIDKIIQRVKQGLRVWEWAKTTESYHEEVMVAAEDFCTWNLMCLKSLLSFSREERQKFYGAFSQREILEMKRWKMGEKLVYLIKYPIASQIALFCVSPIVRFWAKQKKKNVVLE